MKVNLTRMHVQGIIWKSLLGLLFGALGTITASQMVPLIPYGSGFFLALLFISGVRNRLHAAFPFWIDDRPTPVKITFGPYPGNDMHSDFLLSILLTSVYFGLIAGLLSLVISGNKQLRLAGGALALSLLMAYAVGTGFIFFLMSFFINCNCLPGFS